MTVVCSIGTTEPWNAAGLGLDVLALTECGVRPVTVVAGVTAQDRSGIHARFALPPALVTQQLRCLRDAGIAAYRVGALLDVATLDAIAAHLATVREPAVYDPVLAASGGGAFADAALERALVERLAPHVSLLTPNAAEAARLTGVARIDGVAAMETAAAALVARGARAVLVTGGDHAGTAVDVLVDAGATTVFEAPRLPASLRGTGCLLACAIAAEFARGASLRPAIEVARAFVRSKLAAPRTLGPMNVAY